MLSISFERITKIVDNDVAAGQHVYKLRQWTWCDVVFLAHAIESEFHQIDAMGDAFP